MTRDLNSLSIIKKNLEQKCKTSKELIELGYKNNDLPNKNNGAYLVGYVFELFIKIALGCTYGKDSLNNLPRKESERRPKWKSHVGSEDFNWAKIKIKHSKLQSVISLKKIDELKLNNHDVNTFRYDPDYTLSNYLNDPTQSDEQCKEKIVNEILYLERALKGIYDKYKPLFK